MIFKSYNERKNTLLFAIFNESYTVNENLKLMLKALCKLFKKKPFNFLLIQWNYYWKSQKFKTMKFFNLSLPTELLVGAEFIITDFIFIKINFTTKYK